SSSRQGIMFSRSKDKETDKAPAAAAAPISAPASSGGRRPNARTAPSIISGDLVVHGNLTATGDIQIDGTVEGDIRSQSLTIGEKASITGEIVADDIVIRGRVIGTIRGRRVQLSSTCHVEGDILHEALAVETGAFLEGNCRHSDDPISQAGTAPRAAGARPAAPAAPGLGDGPRATPRGAVIGPTRGRRLQLPSACHVECDIRREAVAVATGAFFEGNCRHSDDPIRQAGTAPRAAGARPAAPAAPGLGDGPRATPRPAP